MVVHYNLVVERLKKRLEIQGHGWLQETLYLKKQNKKHQEKREEGEPLNESENYAAILSTYLFKVLIKQIAN